LGGEPSLKHVVAAAPPASPPEPAVMVEIASSYDPTRLSSENGAMRDKRRAGARRRVALALLIAAAAIAATLLLTGSPGDGAEHELEGFLSAWRKGTIARVRP
jgi:hypothetical protein